MVHRNRFEEWHFGRWSLLSAGVLFWLLPLAAWAGGGLTNLLDLTFDQLLEVQVDSVTGVSKYEQKISEAPSSITVVTADEIKKLGHRTLADVLRTVPGIFVSYDRNYSYLGMRGFNRPGDYNGRVLLLVNGHRVNEALYDSALLGTEFPLDVDLIERVEVIRGPSSSVYGNNALFGVINVITRNGKSINGVEVSGEAGSWDTYKGRFTVGKQFTNGVELVMSGSWYDSQGPRRLYYPELDTPAQNHGVADRGDYDNARQFFLHLAWKDLSLEGAYSRRVKGIPTGSFGMDLNDRRNQSIDERPYAELKYHHNFDDRVELNARTFFDYYRYQGYYAYGGVLNYDDAVAKWWGTEIQTRWAVGERLVLSGGSEFNHHFQLDQANWDIDPYALYLSSHQTGWNVAGYGQAEFFLRTNLILSAGYRFDHHSRFKDYGHPRLGLIWAPWDTTTLKWMYGSAFRAPNTYEMDFLWGGYKNNPGLRSETIRTYEMVIEQKLTRKINLSLAGYYYQMDGLISQQTDPADGLFYYGNLPRVTAAGLEAAVEGRLPAHWRWRVSYAFQRTRDELTGAELTSSPRHLGKASLIIPWYRDKLFSGVDLQYGGRSRTLGGQKTGDYWLANLTLFSQRVAKGLEVSASIYNLFDTHYGYVGTLDHVQDVIYQDGRSFRLKLTYHF